MNPSESEFVDRMGLVMERLGTTRTMGRLWGWLMICDPPHQSLTDLATALGVSKTAVSTVSRQLETAGMIERVPTSARGHHYRLVGGGWAYAIKVQLKAMQLSLDTLDFGLSVVDEARTTQRAQVAETREFFAFILHDADEMLHRWEEYRKRSS